MNSQRRFAGRPLLGNVATTTLLSLAALCWSGSVLADDPSAEGTSEVSPQVKEATTRFERGLALFDDGDFDAALVEFIRAYDLSPTYKILYNIAKIERVKNDYSSALTHFERYLSEGGGEIPADRREEVEKEIKVLKDRVAEVSIKANVDGAAVYVDGTPVCGARMVDPTCTGTTPLKSPVVINPGTRKITATKRGYQDAATQITVAGGDKNLVKLDLFDLKPPAEDTGPRNRAIVAWSMTGALAIGAGVMGVLTLNKKNTYDEDRDKVGCQGQNLDTALCNRDTFATLDSDKSDTKTFALVTDILTGAAVVAGGISIYLTVKAANKTEPEQERTALKLRSLRVSAAPGGAVLNGSF
jgi:hypothetical protein